MAQSGSCLLSPKKKYVELYMNWRRHVSMLLMPRNLIKFYIVKHIQLNSLEAQLEEMFSTMNSISYLLLNFK